MFRCHAGCSKNDLFAAFEKLGFGYRRLCKAREGLDLQVVAEYIYREANGQPSYKVVRYKPKEFRQYRWAENGWIAGLGGHRRILYNLPRVLAEPERILFFVEGEKDAETLGRLGFLATTMGGASMRLGDIDAAMLAKRTVCFIPDNDEPGEKYVSENGKILERVGCDVRVTNGPYGDPGSDVSDMVAGATKEEGIAIIKSAYRNSLSLNRWRAFKWVDRMEREDPEFLSQVGNYLQ